MIRSRFRFMLLLLGALLAAFVHADDQQSVVFQEIVSGLVHPLYVTAPDGDPRLFIVEQQGRIRIVKDGKMLPKPFLDLTDRVAYCGRTRFVERRLSSALRAKRLSLRQLYR